MILRALFLSLVLATFAQAAETQSWDLSGYGAFAAGELDGLRVGRDGTLRLGPRVEPLAEIAAETVWDLAVTGKRIYAATGHGGKIFRIDGKKARELWKATESEIFCLEVGPDEALYAGTSPNGKVYRIEPNGKAREYFDPGQEYIWALAFDGERLLVGTGSEGRIYAVDGPGNGEELANTGQRHVMSLLTRADDSFLAGTDPNGVIFRINGAGETFALFDGELGEVRSLARAGDREFALLVGDAVTQSLQAVAAAQQRAVAQAGGAGATVTVSTATTSGPTVTYAGGDKAALVEIADGGAVEVWTSTADTVLGMLPMPGGAHLRVVSASNGRVYDLGPDADAVLVAETRQKQATAIASFGADTLVATSTGGRLFRIEAAPAATGTLTTPVYDAGRIAQWGQFRWNGESEGGSVQIQTRSGNTNQPGRGWSDWSDWQDASGGHASVTSPSARYLQWRIRLTSSESGSPILRDARLRYLPRNGAPRVFSVTVTEQKPEASATSSSSATANTGAAFSITVTDTVDGGGASAVTSGSSTESVATETATKLKIAWSAGDEDGDELDAKIYFRGEGESTWKQIRRKPEKDYILLDNDVLADGRYRFKVLVSDAPANPPDRVRSAEKESEPVLLDRTPPLVRSVEPVSRDAAVFEATDAASDLRVAAYSVDAGEWQPILSTDEIVDSPSERFVVDLEDLAAGEHIVTLRVSDEAGNTGLAKAVIR